MKETVPCIKKIWNYLKRNTILSLKLPNFLTSFLFLFSFFKASTSMNGMLLALASSQCWASPRIQTCIFGRGMYFSLKRETSTIKLRNSPGQSNETQREKFLVYIGRKTDYTRATEEGQHREKWLSLAQLRVASNGSGNTCQIVFITANERVIR